MGKQFPEKDNNDKSVEFKKPKSYNKPFFIHYFSHNFVKQT